MTNKKGNYANPYINKLSWQHHAESGQKGLFILATLGGGKQG